MARSIEAIATLVGARVEAPVGFDLSAAVAGLETVDRAGERDLTFVGNARFARMLSESRACAAVVSESVEIPDGYGGEFDAKPPRAAWRKHGAVLVLLLCALALLLATLLRWG